MSLALVFLCNVASARTLEEALALTYENNPELKAQRKALESVQENVPQSISGFLPSASVDYEKGEERVKIGTAQPADNDVTNTALNFSQPIFSGFETISEMERAYNQVSASRAELLEKEQKVMLEAVNAYVDVVEKMEILDLSKKVEEVLNEHLKATEDRYELGENTKTDISQAKSRLSSAKTTTINSEGDLTVAFSNYIKIVGDEEIPLFLPLKLPTIPKTLNEAVDLAIKSNPQILEAKFQSKVAENDIDVATSSLYPDIDVVGRVSRSDGASTFGSGVIENDSILLNLSIPLYQSGSEYSKVRQSKIDAKRSSLEIIDAKNKAVADVKKSWNELITSKSTIVSTIDFVESSSLALEGVKAEAEYGKRSVLDVLDAEQELFEAQIELTKAKSNEVRSTYSLKSVIGELNAMKLGLKVKLYNPDEHLEKIKYRFVGF